MKRRKEKKKGQTWRPFPIMGLYRRERRTKGGKKEKRGKGKGEGRNRCEERVLLSLC